MAPTISPPPDSPWLAFWTLVFRAAADLEARQVSPAPEQFECQE